MIRVQAEAIFRSFEHGASRADLAWRMARVASTSTFTVVGIDQIVSGISKEGMALVPDRTMR